MGLFNLFSAKYDMDTLEVINAIPIPAKDYNTGNPAKDCIYYLLQRKATEHKKTEIWNWLLPVCENPMIYLITNDNRY